MKQVFTNAKVLVPGTKSPLPLNVATDGDLIARVSEEAPSGANSIDFNGAILTPGIIDLAVFKFDEPAFHFGGITRAALMPDQAPVRDLPAMIKQSSSEGTPSLWPHPLAGATRGLKGTELA